MRGLFCNQNEAKYSHNKYLDKSFLIEMTLKLSKSRKAKKKEKKEIKFAI